MKHISRILLTVARWLIRAAHHINPNMVEPVQLTPAEAVRIAHILAGKP